MAFIGSKYFYLFMCKFYFPEINKNKKENFFFCCCRLKCFLKLTKSSNGARILSFIMSDSIMTCFERMLNIRQLMIYISVNN